MKLFKYAIVEALLWGDFMDKYNVSYHFKRAGCRIPGFGNGCATCPIRRMFNKSCSGLELDEIINAGKKLYHTDKKYCESINIEIKDYPNFRPYVCGCKIV